jgi:spore germination protein GerM
MYKNLIKPLFRNFYYLRENENNYFLQQRVQVCINDCNNILQKCIA